MNKDGKMLVFLVDDDVFYLKTVVMGLDKHYHSSVVFKYFFNSHDLLAELKKREHMPDLILLDYNLDDVTDSSVLLPCVAKFTCLVVVCRHCLMLLVW